MEEQIQWVLLYVQGGLVDVWKENLLEDLEVEEVEFGSVGEFLLELKRKFEEESVKIAELKRIEQEERTMKEFVQKFQRAAKESRYEGRALVKEFKRGISGAIRRNLMEVERPPTSIDQWYKNATNLDRY